MIRLRRAPLLVPLLVSLLLSGGASGAPKSPSAAKPPGAGKGPTQSAEVRREKAARAHFDKAEQAFNLGKFREALRAYEAAYEAMPLPPFLFNIAQCHRNIGNHERAVFFYQRYLALEPSPPNRRTVEDLITEEHRRLVEEESAAAAAVPPPEVAPPTPTPPPTAGPPPATASFGEYRARPDLLARPGLVSEPPADRFYTSPWFLGAVGTAVLVGAAAALLITREGPLPRGDLPSIDGRVEMK